MLLMLRPFLARAALALACLGSTTVGGLRAADSAHDGDPESPAAKEKRLEWFRHDRYGLFIHWGLYAIPGRGSEWYARHMYATLGMIDWHRERYGPQDEFGYKDFIPLFKAEKFDATAWVELFRRARAKYVMPVAEHHDARERDGREGEHDRDDGEAEHLQPHGREPPDGERGTDADAERREGHDERELDHGTSR